MTEMEQIKNLFKVGAELGFFYGNGEPIGTGKDVVTKVSEKSCWFGPTRKSWNTVKSQFEAGIFREL